jgi:hypothetical protein
MMTKIRVFGPFHSGTNLIHNIINESNCMHSGTGKIITANQNDKHDLIPNFNEDEYVILMYKNLYNWIYSINKEPYDMVFNELTSTISFRGETFQNIIHLYNSYYLTYMDLLTSKNKNIVFLDYVKVIDKESGFDYINGKLEGLGLVLQNKEKFTEVLGKPAKNHGFSRKNSDDALAYYLPNQVLYKKFIHEQTLIGHFVDEDITDFFE